MKGTKKYRWIPVVVVWLLGWSAYYGFDYVKSGTNGMNAAACLFLGLFLGGLHVSLTRNRKVAWVLITLLMFLGVVSFAAKAIAMIFIFDDWILKLFAAAILLTISGFVWYYLFRPWFSKKTEFIEMAPVCRDGK